MLSAYFDESGTHDGSVAIAIGGYSGTPTTWLAFERQWTGILRARGIDCFHTVEFERRAPPFDLGDDERSLLIASLIDCIRSHDLIATAAVVKRADFEMARFPGAKSQINDPYMVLAMKVMSAFAFFARSIDQRVMFTFDRRQKITGIVTELLGAMRHEYPIIAPSISDQVVLGSTREFVPLQAADLLSYEVYRRGCDFSAPKRKSFEALSERHLKLFVVGPGELALYGPDQTLRRIAKDVW